MSRDLTPPITITLTWNQATQLETLLESVTNGHECPRLARAYSQIVRKLSNAFDSVAANTPEAKEFQRLVPSATNVRYYPPDPPRTATLIRWEEFRWTCNREADNRLLYVYKYNLRPPAPGAEALRLPEVTKVTKYEWRGTVSEQRAGKPFGTRTLLRQFGPGRFLLCLMAEGETPQWKTIVTLPRPPKKATATESPISGCHNTV